MSSINQFNANVLEVPTEADLPPAGNLPAGVLAHIISTGDCRVTEINAATGARAWVPFCAGSTGATGGSSFDLQFYAALSVTSSPLQFFLIGVDSLFAPVGFVLPITSTTQQVNVHMISNGLTTGTLMVNVLKNGALVAGMGITAATGTGIVTFTTTSTFTASTDKFDLQVSGSDPATPTVTLTATVLFQ